MIHDLRHAARSLFKSPAFTLLAVLTLALGLGANTAIFSVINQVLLRELPYREPEKLVMLWEHNLKRGADMNVISPANYLDWKEQGTLFEDMAAFNDRSYTLTDSGEPLEVRAIGATASLFPMLGVNAMIGRVFAPEDEQPDDPLLALLTYEFWQSRFGGDPGVIGKPITLNGSPTTVIGVLPPDFQFFVKEASFNGRPPQIWVQVRFSAASRERRGRFMAAIGRLKPEATLSQARAEMKAIAAGIAEKFPDFNAGWSVNLVPLHQQLVGEIRPALLVVFGAVGCILFIACANIANLQLARATARAREITLRTALGASRAGIIRLLVLENLLLALGGALAGVIIARWGVDALQQLMPPNLLPTETIPLDGGVLGFTFGIAAVSGIAFGLAPAILASNPRLAEALKDSSHGATTARGRRTRSLFVVAQVALTCVVLVGAGLLVRSFERLVSTDVGFDPRNLVVATVALPPSSYPESQQVLEFYRRLITRIESLPGVRAVTGNVFAPFSGPGAGTGFTVDGRPPPAAGDQSVTDVRMVAPAYFSTLGIPLRRGRVFTDAEHTEARHVVIISEALARKHFPDRDPIGERLFIHMGQAHEGPSEIVGVVGDIRHDRLDRPAREMVYWPHPELPTRFMSLLVRTEVPASTLGALIQREVAALDANLPVARLSTMEQLVADTTVRARFAMLLFSLFGALALLLAVIGIYGVVSYTVARQTREIGIRMAIGAPHGRIVRNVLEHGTRLALAGIGLGLVAAFGLTRLLASLLYDIGATDPLTFTLVPTVLLLLTAAACYLPARRAARIDPLIALRTE